MANEYYKIATEQGYSVDVSKHMNKGWELFKANAGEFIGFSVVAFLIFLVSAFIPIIGNIIPWPLMLGVAIVGHRLDKGRPHQFSTFFDGYQKFLEIFLVNIFMGLIIVVIVSPILLMVFLTVGFDFEGSQPSTGTFATIIIGMLTLMPVLVYLTVSWTFSLYFVAFHNLSSWDALEASRKLVNKNWIGIFGFLLIVGFLTIIISIFTLFLGLLVLVPWSYLCMYSLFEDITKFDDETKKDDLFEHFVN